jgi:nicotinamidase/pyrazinamidase
MERSAFAIIDVQRGFMPKSEGERLHLEGFGELGVAGGEQIVERINSVTEAMARQAAGTIITTQDWHPLETAHFSDNPNFESTWPMHCVAGTPGALLHPDLTVAKYPGMSYAFTKGEEPCLRPEDDTSYTGALARGARDGQSLPDFLRNREIEHVYVAGLALGDGESYPLCVDSTAIDLKQAGFEVTVVIDAVEAVLPENRQKCFKALGRHGINLAAVEHVVARLQEQDNE